MPCHIDQVSGSRPVDNPAVAAMTILLSITLMVLIAICKGASPRRGSAGQI
jgi:hypothetical protein